MFDYEIRWRCDSYFTGTQYFVKPQYIKEIPSPWGIGFLTISPLTHCLGPSDLGTICSRPDLLLSGSVKVELLYCRLSEQSTLSSHIEPRTPDVVAWPVPSRNCRDCQGLLPLSWVDHSTEFLWPSRGWIVAEGVAGGEVGLLLRFGPFWLICKKWEKGSYLSPSWELISPPIVSCSSCRWQGWLKNNTKEIVASWSVSRIGSWAKTAGNSLV